MFLTLTTTHHPATDLGYLLHKHPDRFQTYELSFGNAHAYYPEVTDNRATACLLLDVDAVGLVRGRNPDQDFLLSQYVNDRPYVASSFLSVAIAQVYGSALNGRCKTRPDLIDLPMPLQARIEVLPIRGGEPFLRSVFEPLGYEVEAWRHPLDETNPDWGESPYYSVSIRQTLPLTLLLSHLYVLIPVFDARKHYYVGEDEIDKLLAKGEGWLIGHPAREEITRRYLGNRPSLFRMALSRLVTEEEVVAFDEDETTSEKPEELPEAPKRLNDQRMVVVLAMLKASGAKRVIDLGCGEGRLVRDLIDDRQFDQVVGVDVSVKALEIATRRLRLNQMPDRQKERVTLIHGSLMYRDERFEGFDAAAVVEVIEHLDPPRLIAFERVLFEFARPTTVVLTTPNREYNAVWENLPEGKMRHSDHRFEWTRAEFQHWATGIGDRFSYAVRFEPIGPEHAELGAPTQMAVFTLRSQAAVNQIAGSSEQAN